MLVFTHATCVDQTVARVRRKSDAPTQRFGRRCVRASVSGCRSRSGSHIDMGLSRVARSRCARSRIVVRGRASSRVAVLRRHDRRLPTSARANVTARSWLVHHGTTRCAHSGSHRCLAALTRSRSPPRHPAYAPGRRLRIVRRSARGMSRVGLPCARTGERDRGWMPPGGRFAWP